MFIDKAKLTDLLAKRKAAVTNLEARIAALDAGELKYQGEVCGNGHNGLRYTSGGSCVDCVQNTARVNGGRTTEQTR